MKALNLSMKNLNNVILRAIVKKNNIILLNFFKKCGFILIEENSLKWVLIKIWEDDMKIGLVGLGY